MIHPDILRLLSPFAAYTVFELETYCSGIWRGRMALDADDRPQREWDVNQIEAELRVGRKAGWVVEVPGGWLLVPEDKRPKPSPQRTLFGED